MKTADEISKIKTCALYILKNFDNGIDYIKLFKIMYFAQQDHLIKFGKPIFNETFHALKHGPAPSFTYKCFQILDGRLPSTDNDLENFIHSFRINTETKQVFPNEEPDMDELSKSNIKSLDKAIEKCSNLDSYSLSEMSHDEAWTNAFSRAMDDPEKDRMSSIEIAKAGNATDDVINHIREKERLKRALLM